MTFQVSLSPSAIADAEEAYLWYRVRNSVFADAWFNGPTEAIKSLELSPARRPLAPESQEIEKFAFSSTRNPRDLPTVFCSGFLK